MSTRKTINNRKLDKRCKLTKEQELELISLKDTGVSQREAARMFGISRRLVQFRWYPEKLEENIERRAERGGSKQYYSTEEHKISMRKHREYKKELSEKGLI